ncbi:MAG: alanine racemase [Rhizobiaceae bacterium]|nr:alanine racemase [Rhizobiaceae bacterium]
MNPATYNVDEHLATCRLTIDHAALCDNWRALDAASPGARTAAVVKANGYGLGLGEVGLSLAAAGCEVFFVATPDEGVRLRRMLKTREIFVFNGLTIQNAAVYAENGLVPVLNTLDDINVWSQFWKLRGSRKPCGVQLDTGMNRMGLSEKEVAQFVANQELQHSVNIITVISHLACADEVNNAMNGEQLQRFVKRSKAFGECELSLANSAGIGLGADYHFNLVRPGIALYGGECSAPGKNLMKPVVKAEAKIVQVRQVNKGDVIGYGGTHVFERDSTVALVAAGYGDGYHRAASGAGVAARNDKSSGGFGAIGGHKVPIIGRISMDLMAFDISKVPAQIIENEAFIELFGHDILLDDAARAAGTIGYELLTSLGQRYFRNHINQPEHSPNNG